MTGFWETGQGREADPDEFLARRREMALAAESGQVPELARAIATDLGLWWADRHRAAHRQILTVMRQELAGPLPGVEVVPSALAAARAEAAALAREAADRRARAAAAEPGRARAAALARRRDELAAAVDRLRRRLAELSQAGGPP